MFLRNWARLYSKPTTPELLLECEIAKLGKPYRAQHPFFGMRRIVDFALIQERIIIEVDGSSHDRPAQRYKDITSTIALEKQGWRVVRVSNEAVIADPVSTLKRALEKISSRPTLQELELALQDLDPGPVVKRAKRRVRKKVPDQSRCRNPRNAKRTIST